MAVSSAQNSAFGGLTAGSATAAPTMKAGTYDIGVDNSAFSFSESFTQGDAISAMGAGVDVSADGLVVDMPAFGNTTTQSGWCKRFTRRYYFEFWNYDLDRRRCKHFSRRPICK